LLLIALVRGVGWVLRHRRREIPYGPYLSLTAVLVMLARDPVWRLISGIFASDYDMESWR
jgi:prepilin signal peptidase PulO-like enzyme (type II secretory pathway)